MGHLQKTEQEIIEHLDALDEATVHNFRMMYSYFQLHDLLGHTNHCTVIYEIYLNKRNADKRNAGLMLAAHVCDNTFYKYRRIYLNCYEHIARGEYQIWSEAAFTDSTL